MTRDTRTDKQIREHYLVEKKLAKQLRDAPATERGALYAKLYDKLFELVPTHPQLTRRADVAARENDTRAQWRGIKKFVDKGTTLLELGPGDCSLSLWSASRVKRVIAVDVSKTITDQATCPINFELVISDGRSVPVAAASVDVAYSNQLMEHLHPDDAKEQLAQIYDALRPGGMYYCITPNRLSGPHDISKYFDDEATGFHLKEYTLKELKEAFQLAGFQKFAIRVGTGGRTIPFPSFLVTLTESILDVLPRGIARPLARITPVRLILGIKLLAYK